MDMKLKFCADCKYDEDAQWCWHPDNVYYDVSFYGVRTYTINPEWDINEDNMCQWHKKGKKIKHAFERPVAI